MNMRKVVVLSGLSGSGKSTYARNLILDHLGIQVGEEVTLEHILAVMPDDDQRCTISYCSADRYFMKDGEYQFNPAELSAAHNSCFLAYISALLEEKELVIVDNTNLSPVEIAPYMLAAGAYDYEAEIITLRCSMAMAYERNVHGVPERGIENQWVALNSRQLPPWWKNTDIVVPDPQDAVAC
jgi:predicted kinase